MAGIEPVDYMISNYERMQPTPTFKLEPELNVSMMYNVAVDFLREAEEPVQSMWRVGASASASATCRGGGEEKWGTTARQQHSITRLT